MICTVPVALRCILSTQLYRSSYNCRVKDFLILYLLDVSDLRCCDILARKFPKHQFTISTQRTAAFLSANPFDKSQCHSHTNQKIAS